jgi:hypothetical protein
MVLEEDPRLTVRKIRGLDKLESIKTACPYTVFQNKEISTLKKDCVNLSNRPLRENIESGQTDELDIKLNHLLKPYSLNGNKVSTDSAENYDLSKVISDDDTRILIRPTAAYVKGFARLNFQQEKGFIQHNSVVEETDLLIDTGCMISTISTEFYNKLNDNSPRQRFLNTSLTLGIVTTKKNR